VRKFRQNPRFEWLTGVELLPEATGGRFARSLRALATDLKVEASDGVAGRFELEDVSMRFVMRP
jgi:hypothetical protein